jgi:streptogramin lyase
MMFRMSEGENKSHFRIKTGLALVGLASLVVAACSLGGGSGGGGQVTLPTITTVAGNGTAEYSGDGGLATLAELNRPNGVAVDAAGNIYIADTANSRVRKVTSGKIKTVAGSATSGYFGDGGAPTSAELSNLTGVAIDNGGNIAIADRFNNVIRKVTSTTITTVAGQGPPILGDYFGDGGAPTSAKLNQPYGVAVDSAGNIFIADFSNNVIRKVTSTKITTVAGQGPPILGDYFGDGGAPTSAKLNWPQGVAVDSAGNLYIADYSNNVIRKVTSTKITTVAGQGPTLGGYSGDNGPATAAKLNQPSGVAVDTSGNLYIADMGNNVIRKVSTGGTIKTVAGNGTAGYSGDGGAPTSAKLNQPRGVAVDAAGALYIADTQNNVIRKVK